MINALAACDHLLIPVLAEFLALKGLDRMVHTIKMVFHSRKTPPKFTIVPTMFDKRTKAARDSLAALYQQYPDNAWRSVIPVDTKVRDASQAGAPLPLFDKMPGLAKPIPNCWNCYCLRKAETKPWRRVHEAKIPPGIVKQQLALDAYLQTLLDDVPDADASVEAKAPSSPEAKPVTLVARQPAPIVAEVSPPVLEAESKARKARISSPDTVLAAVENPAKLQALSVMPDWSQYEFQALFSKSIN